MYRSPIEIVMTDIQHQIAKEQDEQIYKTVVSVGINVDKDELIRALQYDRNQYSMGYADSTPKWIRVTEMLPEQFVNVLVFRDGKISIDYHDGNGWFSYDFNGKRATHWMPLPEPPEGE